MDSIGAYTKGKILTEAEMYKELLAFQPLAKQFPIRDAEFKWGSLTPKSTVLSINFSGICGDFTYPFTVEIVPHYRHPTVEPIAILIEPDSFFEFAMQLSEKSPHLYREFNGQLICAHMRDWDSNCTFGVYFMNCVVQWANNATAFIASNGQWDPNLWFTAKG